MEDCLQYSGPYAKDYGCAKEPPGQHYDFPLFREYHNDKDQTGPPAGVPPYNYLRLQGSFI